MEGTEASHSTDAESTHADIFLYLGSINMQGYHELCKILANEPPENGAQKAMLVLGTLGGDANAAYRICRALHHHYEKGFKLFIPGKCKSAGTLIAIGATELIIADSGELGPLDVQISRKDELFERSSGLDLPQAIDYLGGEMRNTFKHTLIDIKLGGGLSTSIAAKIATDLTVGAYAPIYAQIDPSRVGETQRANMIAFSYGVRLSSKSKNLKHDALVSLLNGYPSHSFVIDRKEARQLFVNVSRPPKHVAELFPSTDFFGPAVGEDDPLVQRLNDLEPSTSKENNEDPSTGAKATDAIEENEDDKPTPKKASATRKGTKGQRRTSNGKKTGH